MRASVVRRRKRREKREDGDEDEGRGEVFLRGVGGV